MAEQAPALEVQPFTWSPELEGHFLDSFIMDDGVTIFRPEERHTGLRPLKVFTSYLLFCRRAFDGGPPPDNCTIDEFQKKMEAMFQLPSEEPEGPLPDLTEANLQAK